MWRRFFFFIVAALLFANSNAHSQVKTQSDRRAAVRRELRERENPRAAAKWYLRKRLPLGQKFIPIEKYETARRELRDMPRYASASGRILASLSDQRALNSAITSPIGSWTALGPGNIGGRVRAIVIDPTSPSTIYTAGVAGGVWKSTNGGASWAALDDQMGNLAVSTLAMDPHNHLVLYAGTGEGYFNGDAVNGNGILKSTDGGASWTQLASTAGTGGPFAFVNKIVVSPNSSSRVYATTWQGIFRSLDGGSTWARTHDTGGTDGCFDMVIRSDVTTADSIVASCGEFFPATIYRNTNAGGTGAWTAVFTDKDASGNMIMGRTSLALAPSNQNTIYAMATLLTSGAATGNFVLGLDGIFRSTSGGAAGTWTTQWRNTGDATNINNLLLTNALFASATCGESQFINQGWYDNVIAVDPADSGIVWAGGIDLFRSNDGGQSWGLASYWWDGPSTPANPDFVHADQHAIVFAPGYNGSSNQTIYVGNDGGVFVTTNARGTTATGAASICDPAQTQVAWSSLDNGLAITQFYDGVGYGDGTQYIGGSQDNGTEIGSDAAGANGWTQVLTGDGGYVAANGGTLYAETDFGQIENSTDGGATFFDATSGIDTSIDSGFPLIATFVMDQGNGNNLWTGGNYIWRTTDGAANWTRASTQLPAVAALGSAADTLSAIAVHPANSDLVLVGTQNGNILRNSAALSASSSTVWASTTIGTGGPFISWLAWDPNNQSVAYATVSTFGQHHVWKTMSAGVSWTAIDGSGANRVPDIPVHTIAVDPLTNALYIGTDLGVMVSLDGGANWFVENTGFANVVVDAVSISSRQGASNVYAFTHGRGAWRVAIAPPHLQISVPASTTAGASFSVTVKVLDSGGAPVSSYERTLHFSSSDANAFLPSDYTFTASDAGVHTFTVTLTKAGAQTITVADTNASSLSATSSSIAVAAAAANHLMVNAPASATAGISFSFTVTAQDPFNNTATSYAGTVHFAASDSKAVLPANATLTNGAGTFNATLKTAGAQKIVAADTVNGAISGFDTITVNAAAASKLSLLVPATAKQGLAFNIQVSAQDAFGNTASSYRGTVQFASSDAAAALPANYTFVSGDAGAHVFSVTLNTTGTQSLTATDTLTASITGSASSTVGTTDPKLHGIGRTLRLFRAEPQVIVAAFTDDDTGESGGNLSAKINWGDGSATDTDTTIVHIGGLPNLFHVIGGHAYKKKGPFSITVTMTDSQGGSATATSTARFGPRNLSY